MAGGYAVLVCNFEKKGESESSLMSEKKISIELHHNAMLIAVHNRSQA